MRQYFEKDILLQPTNLEFSFLSFSWKGRPWLWPEDSYSSVQSKHHSQNNDSFACMLWMQDFDL